MFPRRALAVLALGLLTGCREDRVVARVGQYTLTRRDCELRDRITRIYAPDESRDLGRQQLVNAYARAQVLQNLGYAISDRMLLAEAERIESTTLSPESLTRIHRLFNGDDESYRRVYVLPVLVERAIYFDVFLHDEQAQRVARERAEGYLRELRSAPRRWEELARENHFPRDTYLLDAAGMLRAIQEAPVPEHDSLGVEVPLRVRQALARETDSVLTEAADLRRLPRGAVHPRLVDRGDHWLILRCVGAHHGEVKVDALHVPKENYEHWLRDQLAKVAIRVEGE